MVLAGCVYSNTSIQLINTDSNRGSKRVLLETGEQLVELPEDTAMCINISVAFLTDSNTNHRQYLIQVDAGI